MFIENQLHELGYDRPKMPKPMPKDHKYYAQADNLWNMPNRMAAKSGKYLRNFSPIPVRDYSPQPYQARSSSIANSIEKLRGHRDTCQERLLRRKNERQMLQARVFNSELEQSVQSKSTDISHRFKASHDWDSVENHSKKRIKALYTPHILEKDVEAISFIEKSKAEKEKKVQQRNHWFLGRRDEMRNSLMLRHNSIRELEEKAGIRKIRHSHRSVGKQEYDLTDYGMMKPLAEATHRTSKLSLPKLQYRSANPYAAIEFRGLIHTDHQAIAEKRSNSVSPKPTLKSNDTSFSKISMNREFLNKSSLGTIYDEEEREDNTDSVAQIAHFDIKDMYTKLGINCTQDGLGLKYTKDRIPSRVSNDTISSNFTFGGFDI